MIEEDLNSNDSEKKLNSPAKTSYCRQSVELAIKKKIKENFENLKARTSKRIEAMESIALSSRKYEKPFIIRNNSKKIQDEVTRDSKEILGTLRHNYLEQRSSRNLLSFDIREYQKGARLEPLENKLTHNRVKTSTTKLMSHKRMNTLGNNSITVSVNSVSSR